MKYLWLNENGCKDTRSISMEAGCDFIGREYHIKVINNLQHDSPRKVKRFRSAFTTDQVNYLEKQFKKSPYIGNVHRKEVAAALKIPERAVKIWFQNRRMREKKESTTKEFDDGQGIRTSLEFTKDQLTNVVPSTNEKPRSLPLLTNLSQGNCYENMNKEGRNKLGTKQMVQGVEIKDSAKIVEQQALKKKAEDPKKIEEPKYTCVVEHMMPEDLSASRKMNIPTMGSTKTHLGNASSNPGFVSLVPTVSPFYTQPYISASGVIWKPVSVMPVVTSSSSPVTAPSNRLLNMSTVQENFANRPCDCNCHVKQVMHQVPYSFP